MTSVSALPSSPVSVRLARYAGHFSGLESQKERLEALIELGSEQAWPTTRQEWRGEDRVPGCVSDVFITAQLKQGKVFFSAVADALVTRGHLVILLKALDGLSPSDIIASEPAIKEFIAQAHLEASLVPSRANAFGRMHQFMVKLAERFS